ncbi:MAG: hypothetical protein H7175_22780 [Burkholderiales bacterium]|nr:hypothetical protein [Anaerolineae bacterium]
MSIIVEKLPDEPIIVVTYAGELNLEIVSAAFRQSAEIMDRLDGTVYRISDIRQGTSEFSDTMDIIHRIRHSRNVSGSTLDPRLKAVFVGSHVLAEMYADILKQSEYGGKEIPFFNEMDDALAYIRSDMIGSVAPSE